MSRYSDGPLGWIGVDFDRTLCTRQHDGGPELGEPIQPMVDRVKRWLAEGRRVKIFTARVSGFYKPGIDGDQARAGAQYNLIVDWCEKHLGWTLEVTCIKDSYCKEIWDDIAVAVEENTGQQLSDSKIAGPARHFMPPSHFMLPIAKTNGQLCGITEKMQQGGFVD
jgi:hypothetical protein